MNTELMEALNVLEKEKNIRKEVVLKAIEESLVQACKHHFGKSDNIVVIWITIQASTRSIWQRK